MDADTDDIASGLSNCITKDGQTTVTDDITLSSHKLTDVTSATLRSDAANLGQIQDATVNWVADSGSADALAATYSPALTAALVDGQLCFVRAANANATTTPTFAPNGLTAHTIVKAGSTALVAGDIAAGQDLILRYDLSNTQWELLNPRYGAGVGTLAAADIWSTGDVKVTIKTTADSGWVMMDDGTIGDASSGGTTRANADTSALFALIWNNIANTDCPIQDSSGSASTRGVSASADYAAHKRMPLPKVLGRALSVSGHGSGLSSRNLGNTAGAETHSITKSELPAEAPTATSTISGAPQVQIGTVNGGGSLQLSTSGSASSPANLSSTVGTLAVSTTIDNLGSGTAMNLMQPTSFLNVMIKL